MGTLPGSLSEGAVERSETEGVYFGERKRSKISEPTMAYGYPLARRNHRTTLPQSALRAASSLREGAGKGCTTHRTARKPERCGRFSSPLRNSKEFTFYHSTDDTPSASLRSAAPSEREPGTSCTTHRTARKPQDFGRFSSPLRKLKGSCGKMISQSLCQQSPLFCVL